MVDPSDPNGERAAEATPAIPHEDFTQEPVGPVGADAGTEGADARDASRGEPVSAQLGSPYSLQLGGVQKHREDTRRWLAYGMVLLLAAVTLLSLAAVVFEWQTSDEVRAITEVLFTPIVALTGSALGFFFGIERGS
jgi:hypothetical protein